MPTSPDDTVSDAVDVRRYRDDDRAQLIALWRRVFPDDPPHNEPSAVIDAKLRVDDLIFVAMLNGAVVGAAMAGYDGHRGWLYAVAVDEAVRRMSIGGALVRHAVAVLNGLGCGKVNLQVRSTNASVVAFYEALGFTIEDRISMGLLDRGTSG